MTRKPFVAGMFYEEDPELLTNDIKNIFKSTHGNDINLKESSNKREIIAGVSPHAGYIYSGPTASYTYKKIAEDGLPETFIIIGPSHTGIGDAITTTTDKTWLTPLGEIEVDEEFKKALMEEDPYLIEDDTAHAHEHSVEVEIPFIQYIAKLQEKEVKIVPIVIKNQIPMICEALGENIKKTIEKTGRDVVVIASTDLTHYENSDEAEIKDTKVLNAIETLDSEDLIDQIMDYQISMCGYGPTIVAMELAKLLNANDSIILNYSNSGSYNDDYESVVGYGSAILKK